MEKGKILSKKEQIELIIDRIRRIDEINSKLEDVFCDCIDIFSGIYDIGYQLIPVILGLSVDEDEIIELQDNAIYEVMNNCISKEKFFKKIDKYLKEEK